MDAKKEAEEFRKVGRTEKEERELQTQETARVLAWRAGQARDLQVILYDKHGA